jgi:hypothetical protein
MSGPLFLCVSAPLRDKKSAAADAARLGVLPAAVGLCENKKKRIGRAKQGRRKASPPRRTGQAD